MIFLGGLSALGGDKTSNPTPTSITDIKTITVQNSVIDDLFITTDMTSMIPPLDKTWNFQTVLHATYNNVLTAGNVEFSMAQISAIRIKKREAGTYIWTLMYDIPIAKTEDLTFERYDRSSKGGKTKYEYCFIPVLNGIDGNLNINTVISDFGAMVLSEKDTTYLTPLDVKVSPTKNRASSIVNTLDGKYPTVIYNSSNNYYSGTASGVFIQFDPDTCEWDIENGWKYREPFMEFLTDGLPKVLKLQDGRAWIVSIVDNPSEDNSQHEYKAITTFSWVETGDINSTQDLYDNGLIDARPESW